MQGNVLRIGFTIILVILAFNPIFGQCDSLEEASKAELGKNRVDALNEYARCFFEPDSEQQRDMLQKAFEDWRGNMERIDDICIMGIKIG